MGGEREDIRSKGSHFTDLGSLAADVRKQAVRHARRGLDIVHLADLSWTVCTICDGPSVAALDGSVCCGGTTRIQGWAMGGVLINEGRP